MEKELIIVITEHRKFGTIFSSYIITPSEGSSFYTSIEMANNINVKETTNFTDVEATIVKYITEYDDSYIANLFTKKKEDAREFIRKVDNEFIQNRIRPHIDKRILKVMHLLPKSKLKIFVKDKNYSKIYADNEIKLAGPNAQAVFNFNRNSEGIQYFLSIHHEGDEIRLKNKKIYVLTDSPCTIAVDNKLYTFHDIDSKKLLPFFDKEYISIAKQTEKVYFEKFILSAVTNYKVMAKGFDVIENSENPKPFLYLQNDLSGVPVLLMKYQYGSNVILPNNPNKSFVALKPSADAYTFYKDKRNFGYENNLTVELKTIGLSTLDRTLFYPEKSELNQETDAFYNMIAWLNENTSSIEKLGITLKQNFFDKKYYLSDIRLNISIKNTNDWFDIHGNVELSGFTLPFLKLRKNIIKNIREYELPDGSIIILPAEWFVKYKELFLFAHTTHEGLQLNKMHFKLLNGEATGLKSGYADKIKELFNTETLENLTIPEGLNATLRPYQITGFTWMNQLKNHEFGGCLADDMGLGKTLQTLTLLLKNSDDEVVLPDFEAPANMQLSLFDAPVKTNTKKTRPTSLIVMPASLIYNWFNEIEKFAPKLKAFKHVGNNRTKNISDFAAYDIILTTYGVIRNDYESLKMFPFHYVILDESQVIKNPDSKIYQSIIQLVGKHKLVLTGTPIENSLTDLWSQMNFVNRGLLGNFNFFKTEFVAPIEKLNDKRKSERLQSLIHPFILRRTKEQVAKDLPARTEQIRICEMSDSQRKIYEVEKSQVRNSLLENMEKHGVQKSSLMVLKALTRLRQLANHPKLINDDAESGKFEEVTRMLNNVISEGHKVLIFSSFVQHLEIYKNYLDGQNQKYSILTGKTQNRQQVIEEFQNNTDISVFLISLKAGGVGLNLTAADYVFLLDPWWNPASENQAINRAHRIGQDKKVFVYRFISSDSIEEKIVRLQDKKSELADMFINNNNPFKALTTEKIKELLE